MRKLVATTPLSCQEPSGSSAFTRRQQDPGAGAEPQPLRVPGQPCRGAARGLLGDTDAPVLALCWHLPAWIMQTRLCLSCGWGWDERGSLLLRARLTGDAGDSVARQSPVVLSGSFIPSRAWGSLSARPTGCTKRSLFPFRPGCWPCCSRLEIRAWGVAKWAPDHRPSWGSMAVWTWCRSASQT